MSSSPLDSYADSVSGSAVDPDSGGDSMGIGAPDIVDDPTSIHQLSQQAYDQLHPQADDGSDGALSTDTESGGGAGAGDVGNIPAMPLDASEYGNPLGGDFITDDATKAEKIVKFARSMLGQPYVWGGTSRAGADCSGLVQLAYAYAGVPMPRLSNYQMDKGKRVDLKNLKPGDLVGWNNSDHVVGADHIAIYIGNNQIIEAPRPGLDIRVSGLFDYDVGQMWGVRVPGVHVAPTVSRAPRQQTATQVRNSGGSVRAQEAASEAAASPTHAASSAPRKMSQE